MRPSLQSRTAALMATAMAAGESLAKSQSRPLVSMASLCVGMYHPILSRDAMTAVVGPLTTDHTDVEALASLRLASVNAEANWSFGNQLCQCANAQCNAG